MIALFALLLFGQDGLGQDGAPIPPTTFDRAVELELTADDPVGIDGEGPAKTVEYACEFAGTLHVWTSSALDLRLRVDGKTSGTTLAEDDDSGGGTTPYVELTVAEGDELAVRVASAGPEELGPFELHLVAAPETDAAREAASAGREDLTEARRLQAQGDLDAARMAVEELVERLPHVAGAAHSELVAGVLWDLGYLAYELGQLESCRTAWKAAREHGERTLPDDHPLLSSIRGNLAVVMLQLGDLSGACVLLEGALASRERTLPPDHPEVIAARQNLAGALADLGELSRARALFASALESAERTLPDDDPQVLAARMGLAATLAETGDLAGARPFLESVLEARQRTLPPDHPDGLLVRQNLAHVLSGMGELASARALEETVLAARERTLPPDHPSLLRARGNLAVTLRRMGELPDALELEEGVLAARERSLPADHPDVLFARNNLGITLTAGRDLAGARALVEDQVAGLRTRALASLALSPREAREAREAVDASARLLPGLLFWTRSAGADLRGSVFELQETLRLVSLEAARAVRRSNDPEVETAMRNAERVRAELNDLVSSTSERDSAEVFSELTRLMQERDRFERAASRRLEETGVVTRPVEVGPLAEALGARAVAVGYRRVGAWSQDEATGALESEEHLLAHVLRPDRSLVRIDLGRVSELESLVAAWRPALDASSLRGTSIEGGSKADRDTAAAGEALRERLLDPILDEIGDDARRLHVCADDLVFLVPLDALPFGGGHVGDRWSIANEVSFARLLVPGAPAESEPGLFALGGVDYDAGRDALQPGGAGASAPRAREPGRFTPLAQTSQEAESVRALFEQLFDAGPVIRTRAAATKSSLFHDAPGKRYLHLATHGWFAPETVTSTMDGDRGGGPGAGWARLDLSESVRGMAPMLLCGLALAGANQGHDSLGRVSGILTAEELCALDLSTCELAVLSACETNVGIRRAGQGIQSLQAALYAAGARSSITSLWRVDDAATRRLFEAFYTNLWTEKMPKA